MSARRFDPAEAKRERDKRLRRGILMALYNAMNNSPTGELSGRSLKDQAQTGVPFDQKFEDDVHAMGLMRYMVIKGYATERSLTRHKGEQFGLDHLAFRITSQGVELHLERRPADPDVDDDRVDD